MLNALADLSINALLMQGFVVFFIRRFFFGGGGDQISLKYLIVIQRVCRKVLNVRTSLEDEKLMNWK